jgi:hypothetical protein
MAEYTEVLRLVVDASDLDRALGDARRAIDQASNQTASAGKSMTQSLGGVSREADDAAASIGKIGEAATSAGGASGAIGKIGQAAGGVGKAIGGIGEAVGKLGMIGLGANALQAFAGSALELSGINAAREIDNLEAAMRGMAQANDIALDTMHEQVAGIEALNIDAATARNAVVRLTQGQLDLAKATDLVAVAQNASVISGMQTDDVLESLVHGITTQNTMVLRNAGITLDASTAFDAYAEEIGVAAKNMTSAQKQQALMNAVLQEGTKIAGIAKEAQDPIAALPAAIRKLSLAFGRELLPAIKPLAEDIFQFVNSLSKAEVVTGVAHSVAGAARILVGVVREIGGAIGAITDVGGLTGNLSGAFGGAMGGLERFGAWLSDHAPLMVRIVGNILAIAGGLATALMPAVQALLGPLGALTDENSALGDAVSGVLHWLADATDALRENESLLKAIATAVGVAVVGFTAMKIVSTVSGLISGMSAATSAMTLAQWALNAAMSANPIGIVIVAIAALAAGLVYAYNESETFRNIVDAAFSAVAAAASWLWDEVLGPFFGWLADTAWPAVIEAAQTYGPMIIAVAFGPLGIAAYLLRDQLKEVFDWLVWAWQDLQVRWEAAGGDLLTFLKALGPDLVSGLKDGIIAAMTGMGAWLLDNVVNPIVGGIKGALQIGSPSKVMADIGSDIIGGLISGLSSKLGDLRSMVGQVGSVLGGIGSAASSAMSAIGGALSGAASSVTAEGEIADYIRQAASSRGIDPAVAIRVAEHEGGVTEAARRGTFDTGSSWWPYQLHYGGAGTPYESLGTVAGMGNTFTEVTGFQPGDPTAWKASVDYALDEVARAGWGKWYGAAAAGISNWQGVRDDGGWLMPGISTVGNFTGQPERVLAPGQGGFTINLGGLTINAPGGDAASLRSALPAIAEELAAYLADRLDASLHNLAGA